jgi:hypothetical protein
MRSYRRSGITSRAKSAPPACVKSPNGAKSEFEGSAMVSLLVALRDFLVALALAWVGVTIGERGAEEAACAPDSEFCSGQIQE